MMYYTYILQSKKVEIFTQDIQMTYGSASRNMVMENRNIQKVDDLISLYIMKRVLIKLMRGRENYFLNQAKASVILNLV